MTARRLIALAAAGGLGLLLFAALFARFSAASRWQLQISLGEAADMARREAMKRGIDVSGWRSDAAVHRDSDLHDLLTSAGGDAGLALELRVAFLDPRKAGEGVGVALDRDGRLRSIRIRRAAPEGAVSPEDARRIAVAALQSAGVAVGTYQLRAEEDAPGNARRIVWERASSTPGMTNRVSVTVDDDGLRELQTGPALVDAKARGTVVDKVDTARDITVILTAVFGLVLYIVMSVKGMVPQRLALVFVLFFMVLMGTEMFADLQPSAATIFGETAPPRFAVILGAILVGGPLALSVASGHSSMRQRFPRQLEAFEALSLRGAWRSAAVGAEVATGVAVGCWMAALPYVVRASGLFGDYLVRDASTDALGLPPFLPAGLFGSFGAVLLGFAMLIPFVEARLPPRAGRTISAVVAFVVVLSPDAPLGAVLASGVLLAVLADATFRRVGLLAVAVAALASAWIPIVAARLVQPSAVIHADGRISALAAAAIVFFAGAVALRGSRRALDPWQPRIARAERERIQAEFEIARRAQQRMLPSQAPVTAGASIASHCRPARQVGGDLYDFVPMSDGSLGIAVADVSGKGVPAALIMTITKGLLLAAADGRSEPLETVADVNAGIHSLGNRNMFVTMLFGALDPVGRVFRFVRAGHTPLVWRRTSGEVEALAPRGLGLGMAGPSMFARLCEQETITTAPGELLFLFSDGVTEAMNERREEFGDERFLDVVRNQVTSDMSADEACRVVIAAVDRFRGEVPAHDDITLVVVRC